MHIKFPIRHLRENLIKLKRGTSIIPFLVFFGVGVLLLAANIWFIRTAWDALRAQHLPPTIAPFQIIGKDDVDGKIGLALAHILQSRFDRINLEMEALDATFPPIAQSFMHIHDQQRLAADILPIRKPRQIETSGIYKSLDLDITVSGVEIGGLIRSFHRTLVSRQMVQFSLLYTAEKVTIAVHSDADRWKIPSVTMDGTNDEELIDAIAYTIAQTEYIEDSESSEMQEIGGLEWQEFRQLIQTTTDVARLNHQVARGRASVDEYRERLTKLEQIAGELPGWYALIKLTADVAENAEVLATELSYRQQQISLISPSHHDYEETAERISYINASTTSPSRAKLPPLHLCAYSDGTHRFSQQGTL